MWVDAQDPCGPPSSEDSSKPQSWTDSTSTPGLGIEELVNLGVVKTQGDCLVAFFRAPCFEDYGLSIVQQPNGSLTNRNLFICDFVVTAQANEFSTISETKNVGTPQVSQSLDTTNAPTSA